MTVTLEGHRVHRAGSAWRLQEDSVVSKSGINLTVKVHTRRASNAHKTDKVAELRLIVRR